MTRGAPAASRASSPSYNGDAFSIGLASAQGIASKSRSPIRGQACARLDAA